MIVRMNCLLIGRMIIADGSAADRRDRFLTRTLPVAQIHSSLKSSCA